MDGVASASDQLAYIRVSRIIPNRAAPLLQAEVPRWPATLCLQV